MTGCALYILRAILSLKKYETKFMMMARAKAITNPRRPPKICPMNSRKSVKAVSNNAVLKVFPIAAK